VATDGTDQLRYAATEDIKPLLADKRLKQSSWPSCASGNQQPFRFALSTACLLPSPADQGVRVSPAGLAANNIVLPLSFEGERYGTWERFVEAHASLQSYLRHDLPKVIPFTPSRAPV
jgi:hypothetical protein